VIEGLIDLLAFGAFILWGYEVIAFAWPLRHQLAQGVLGAVLFEHVAARVVGAVAMLAGFLLWLAAMRAMWRIGIDRDNPGRLVTEGIFAWTRNPIYSAFGLLLLGSFLMQGRAILLILALFLVPSFTCRFGARNASSRRFMARPIEPTAPASGATSRSDERDRASRTRGGPPRARGTGTPRRSHGAAGLAATIVPLADRGDGRP
jgi:hypothetical protein